MKINELKNGFANEPTSYRANKLSYGLTVIEIVIAVALIALISTIGLIMFNPGGMLAKSRNTQRTLHIQGILNGIRENIADNANVFSCSSGPIPTSTKRMASGGASGTYDIAPCLIPGFLTSMPFDPSPATAHYTSNSDYDTGYNVAWLASTSQVTVSAPSAELNKSISITR